MGQHGPDVGVVERERKRCALRRGNAEAIGAALPGAKLAVRMTSYPADLPGHGRRQPGRRHSAAVAVAGSLFASRPGLIPRPLLEQRHAYQAGTLAPDIDREVSDIPQHFDLVIRSLCITKR